MILQQQQSAKKKRKKCGVKLHTVKYINVQGSFVWIADATAKGGKDIGDLIAMVAFEEAKEDFFDRSTLDWGFKCLPTLKDNVARCAVCGESQDAENVYCTERTEHGVVGVFDIDVIREKMMMMLMVTCCESGGLGR